MLSEILTRLYVARRLHQETSDALLSARQAFNEELRELRDREIILAEREQELEEALNQISETRKADEDFPLPTRRQTYLEVWEPDELVSYCLSYLPQVLVADTGKLDEITDDLVSRNMDFLLRVDYSALESLMKNNMLPSQIHPDVAELKEEITVPIPRKTLEKYVDDEAFDEYFMSETEQLQIRIQEQEESWQA